MSELEQVVDSSQMELLLAMQFHAQRLAKKGKDVYAAWIAVKMYTNVLHGSMQKIKRFE